MYRVVNWVRWDSGAGGGEVGSRNAGVTVGWMSAAARSAESARELRMLGELRVLVGIELRHTARAPRCLEHGEVCIFICGCALEEEFLLCSRGGACAVGA